jgi:hypothetical protein
LEVVSETQLYGYVETEEFARVRYFDRLSLMGRGEEFGQEEVDLLEYDGPELTGCALAEALAYDASPDTMEISVRDVEEAEDVWCNLRDLVCTRFQYSLILIYICECQRDSRSRDRPIGSYHGLLLRS